MRDYHTNMRNFEKENASPREYTEFYELEQRNVTTYTSVQVSQNTQTQGIAQQNDRPQKAFNSLI